MKRLFEKDIRHITDTVTLFEVTYKKDSFVINGKEYPLGYTSFFAIQPDCRFMYTQVYAELERFADSLTDDLSHDGLIEYRSRLITAISSLEKIPFFSLFDLEQYKEKISFLLSEERINQYSEIYAFSQSGFDLSSADKADQADDLMKCLDDFYLVLSLGRILHQAINDLTHYSALVFQITNKIVERGARTKSQLAEAFGACLFDPYCSLIFHTDQQPFCTRASVIPVVEKADGESHLFRKVYYNSMKDFLYTDLFEGYRHGHYLWQCGICDDYFFMTTAHKQLYCSTVNPKYGVPCAYVAKHPEVLQRKPEQQKKTDSPHHLLWKRRNNLIRKNKSLGKYDDAVSAKAKEYIDSCFELAQVDFEYAITQYDKDMEMTNVYRKAMEMLNV